MYGPSSQLNEKLNRLASTTPTHLPSRYASQEWLGYYWNTYTKAHLGLAQLYVDDPRFKSYYDARDGCAEF